MATTYAAKRIAIESTAPGDYNAHIQSSASQTTTPQFLHLTDVAARGPIAVKLWKLASGVWSLVGLFSFANPSDAGIPCGGLNAPLRVQLVGGADSVGFAITDQP